MSLLSQKTQRIHGIYKELSELENKRKTTCILSQEYDDVVNSMQKLKQELNKLMNDTCPILSLKQNK
jgi:hypothetical protein